MPCFALNFFAILTATLLLKVSNPQWFPIFALLVVLVEDFSDAAVGTRTFKWNIQRDLANLIHVTGIVTVVLAACLCTGMKFC